MIWSVIAFNDEYTTKLKIANIRRIFKLNGISLKDDIHVNTSDATRPPLVDILMEIKNTSRSIIIIFSFQIFKSFHFYFHLNRLMAYFICKIVLKCLIEKNQKLNFLIFFLETFKYFSLDSNIWL